MVAFGFPCLERVVQQWHKPTGGPTRVDRLVLALYILIIALVALNVGRVFSFHLTLGLLGVRQGSLVR